MGGWGGGAGERERETYTHRHAHASHSEGRGSRQGREGARVDRERSPKQPCASELGSARAQPACWSSARLSGDLTCSFSSALLYLRLRTLTMSSQFQQVNCFKSCYFSLLRALCTLILALSDDWEHMRKKNQYFKLQIVVEGFCIADLFCPMTGHLLLLLFALEFLGLSPSLSSP